MQKGSTTLKGGKQDPVKWLDGVVNKPTSMTQRKMSAVEKMEGGLAGVTDLARSRGVHLLRLEDDKGDLLIAAGKQEFKIIC